MTQVVYLRYNEQTGVPTTPCPVKQASLPDSSSQSHVSYAGSWSCIRVAGELVQDGCSWDPPQTDRIRAWGVRVQGTFTFNKPPVDSAASLSVKSSVPGRPFSGARTLEPGPGELGYFWSGHHQLALPVFLSSRATEFSSQLFRIKSNTYLVLVIFSLSFLNHYYSVNIYFKDLNSVHTQLQVTMIHNHF